MDEPMRATDDAESAMIGSPPDRGMTFETEHLSDSTRVPGSPDPAPPSYLLVGPPDLLHDLTLDFADIGWQVAAARWQAVVTAAPGDAAAPEPEWPTEVTLAGVRRDGHAAAVAEFLAGPAGGP